MKGRDRGGVSVNVVVIVIVDDGGIDRWQRGFDLLFLAFGRWFHF